MQTYSHYYMCVKQVQSEQKVKSIITRIRFRGIKNQEVWKRKKWSRFWNLLPKFTLRNCFQTFADFGATYKNACEGKSWKSKKG